jgi:hypothetical protein
MPHRLPTSFGLIAVRGHARRLRPVGKTPDLGTSTEHWVRALSRTCPADDATGRLRGQRVTVCRKACQAGVLGAGTPGSPVTDPLNCAQDAITGLFSSRSYEIKGYCADQM